MKNNSGRTKKAWDELAEAWTAWDLAIRDLMQPVTDEMIRLLRPNERDLILDIASGSGEPGVTIAGIVRKGRVTLTDFSEKMLMAATMNAKSRGIDNVTIKTIDVSDLPFERESFDGVVCRHGFMFFADSALAVMNIANVLKRGGRLVISVWNDAASNGWARIIFECMAPYLEGQNKSADGAGIFQWVANAKPTEILKKAGFRNIIESEVRGNLQAGRAENYWNLLEQSRAPMLALLSKADTTRKKAFRQDVIDAIRRMYGNEEIVLEGSSLVICGEKG